MNTPFPMPDEYLQGFLKAAQSLTQSLVTSPVSPNAIAAPPNGAPLADIQFGYLQQQLQLWGRMLTSGVAAEPTSMAPGLSPTALTLTKTGAVSVPP